MTRLSTPLDSLVATTVSITPFRRYHQDQQAEEGVQGRRGQGRRQARAAEQQPEGGPRKEHEKGQAGEFAQEAQKLAKFVEKFAKFARRTATAHGTGQSKDDFRARQGTTSCEKGTSSEKQNC